MGLGAVLCPWFPAVLTTPALREIYDMTLIRALIKLGLLAVFLLGIASLLLKRRKALGVTGIALPSLATCWAARRSRSPRRSRGRATSGWTGSS